MRLYSIALQFLTIIPLPFRVRCEKADLGRSMALFPLVGLTIGSLLVAGDFLFSLLLPRGVVDLLLIVFMTVLTGALHLDGVADVSDGLAARGDRERFLTVMKDPNTGAVGAVGVVLILLLKYQALVAIAEDVKWEALLLFPMMARFAQVLFTVGSRRARIDGLGSLFIEGTGAFQLVVAGLISFLLSVLLFKFQGLMLVAGVSAAVLALKLWFHRRLGGITGDVIGFVSEIAEVLTLLLIIAAMG
jgi:adenosylcobinamide-GDP ribazoletransferase